MLLSLLAADPATPAALLDALHRYASTGKHPQHRDVLAALLRNPRTPPNASLPPSPGATGTCCAPPSNGPDFPRRTRSRCSAATPACRCCVTP